MSNSPFTKLKKPFDFLPSYIRESEDFAKFLRGVDEYIYSGALLVMALKDTFLSEVKSPFVLQALSDQLGIEIEIPFDVNGKPDMDKYYKQLSIAYDARSFCSSFDGTLARWLTANPLSSIGVTELIDFSVQKGSPVPMSILFSTISFDPNLTFPIAYEFLIPKITGVSTTLSHLIYGQDVFGYDLDESDGVELMTSPYEHTQIPIPDSPVLYAVSKAVISTLGSGYAVGQTVLVKIQYDTGKFVSVDLKITSLSVGAALTVLNPYQLYLASETSPNTSLSVTSLDGDAGTGMEVDLTFYSKPLGGGGNYKVVGYDKGVFVPRSKRG